MLFAILVMNGNTCFVLVWDDGLKEGTDIRWVGTGQGGGQAERSGGGW